MIKYIRADIPLLDKVTLDNGFYLADEVDTEIVNLNKEMRDKNDTINEINNERLRLRKALVDIIKYSEEAEIVSADDMLELIAMIDCTAREALALKEERDDYR